MALLWNRKLEYKAHQAAEGVRFAPCVRENNIWCILRPLCLQGSVPLSEPQARIWQQVRACHCTEPFWAGSTLETGNHFLNSVANQWTLRLSSALGATFAASLALQTNVGAAVLGGHKTAGCAVAGMCGHCSTFTGSAAGRGV